VATAAEQFLAPLGPDERGQLEQLLTKLIDAAAAGSPESTAFVSRRRA